MISSKVKEYNMKSLSRKGLIQTGELVISAFIFVRASCISYEIGVNIGDDAFANISPISDTLCSLIFKKAYPYDITRPNNTARLPHK